MLGKNSFLQTDATEKFDNTLLLLILSSALCISLPCEQHLTVLFLLVALVMSSMFDLQASQLNICSTFERATLSCTRVLISNIAGMWTRMLWSELVIAHHPCKVQGTATNFLPTHDYCNLTKPGAAIRQLLFSVASALRFERRSAALCIALWMRSRTYSLRIRLLWIQLLLCWIMRSTTCGNRKPRETYDEWHKFSIATGSSTDHHFFGLLLMSTCNQPWSTCIVSPSLLISIPNYQPRIYMS